MNKKILLLVTLLLQVIIFTSCNEGSSKKINEKISVGDYTKYSETLYINKNIENANPEVLNLSEYNIRKINKDDVLNVLSPESSGKDFDETRNSKGMIYGKMNLEGDSRIEMIINESNDSISSFSYTKNNLDQEYSSVGLSIADNYGIYSPEKTDFQFMTTEDVKNRSTELLKKILGDYEFDYQIYPISKETIDLKIKSDEKSNKNNDQTKSEQRTPEDIYYVNATMKKDSINVLNNEFVGAPETTFYVIGQRIELIFTKDGLTSMGIQMPLLPNESIKSVENVKSIDPDVLESIKKQYKDVLDKSRYFIDKFELVYLPSEYQRTDETTLFPAWKVTVKIETDGQVMTRYNYYSCINGDQLQ